MTYLASVAQVPQADLERTWNAGIGMVAIVDPQVADLTIASLAARGMKSWVAGQIEPADTLTMPGSSVLAGKYQAR
jgi:phosphoribosylformylglycinamidine cyclo-ligase